MRARIATIAGIAALAVAAPATPAQASRASQRLSNAISVIIVCGRIPGGCVSTKLLERTYPGNCTREKYRLYVRRGPARIFLTKACG